MLMRMGNLPVSTRTAPCLPQQGKRARLDIIIVKLRVRVRVRVRVKVKVKSLKSKLDPEVGSVMG